jgi:hypothetical protein
MYYNNKHSTMAKYDSNDISRLNQTAGRYNTFNHFGLRTPAKWQEISTFLMDYLKLCGDHFLTYGSDQKTI